ncbi:MAG: carboxypeptidase-like regulatory domain-containing protein [Acidobacteriota bacterium]
MHLLNFRRSLAVFCLTFVIVGSSFGQKTINSTSVKSGFEVPVSDAPSASVQMVVFNNQNVDCASLNALHANSVGDIRFSHILENNELKLDFGTPNGTFPFSSGNGRIVIGPESPNRSLTVSSSGSTISSWSSQLPITAVILKAGNDSYVFPYKPFSSGDTNLAAGVQQSISHLTFCFGDPSGPTAGEGSISGRVVDSLGNGISKAQLVLINGTTGESRITLTSPFGYYTIQGLDVNELYVLNVSHKSYEFGEKQKTISLTDGLSDVDFVGQTVQ